MVSATESIESEPASAFRTAVSAAASWSRSSVCSSKKYVVCFLSAKSSKVLRLGTPPVPSGPIWFPAFLTDERFAVMR